jgi:hypothetical protein
VNARGIQYRILDRLPIRSACVASRGAPSVAAGYIVIAIGRIGVAVGVRWIIGIRRVPVVSPPPPTTGLRRTVPIPGADVTRSGGGELVRPGFRALLTLLFEGTRDGTCAMFGWLKSKSRGEGTTANTGSEEQMLDAAIREVHPDRFASDIDAALVVQPKLATINLMLGRSNDERVLPIKLDDVVQRVRELRDMDRLQKFIDFAPDSPVVAGLITAAL